MQLTSFYRLLPSDDQSWSLFPLFRKRVHDFIAANLPSTDPAMVIYDMENKWTSLPKTTGYWLGFSDNKCVAHMASYVTESYGRPFVFVYQAEVDEGYSLAGFQKLILGDMDKWVRELNDIIPEGRSKISKAELSTWRDAAVFAKYLEATGREAVKVRSVIEFTVGSSVPALLV